MLKSPIVILYDGYGVEKGIESNPIRIDTIGNTIQPVFVKNPLTTTITDIDGYDINITDGYLSNLPMAIGTGSYVPDPSGIYPEVNTGNKNSLTIDPDGHLIARSQVLTDEESFRDDFDKDDLDNVWNITQIGSGTSYLLSSSKINLVSGTSSGATIGISREADYSAFFCDIYCSISQRINNQSIYIGFTNDLFYDESSLTPHRALVLFDGYDDTKFKFVTHGGKEEIYEETICTLPTEYHTNQQLKYRIEVATTYCSISVNDIILAIHYNHIPGVYIVLDIIATIINTNIPSSSTTIAIDIIHFENNNLVSVTTGGFLGMPIATRAFEETHTLTSTLTTSSTVKDQMLIEYTVPINRIFYIMGWRFSSSNSGVAIAAEPLKIGKNNISSEPSSPGVIDSNIFRTIYTLRETTVEENYSICPRILAKGGDVVKVAVSPNNSSVIIWRFSMDFVLR